MVIRFMDQTDEERNEVKEVGPSPSSNVVNVGGKENPTFIGDGTTVNINVKNTLKIDAKALPELPNLVNNNNFKAISNFTEGIYDDRKIGVTNDTEYELPVNSIKSIAETVEEPREEISQAVDGNCKKVYNKQILEDLLTSSNSKCSSKVDDENKILAKTNNRKKENSNVLGLIEKVEIFCKTSSELERMKFEESINADLNSLSVTLTDCKICQAESSMREFLLREDTDNIINGIGIYASMLTVILKYGLLAHLMNKTTTRSLLSRLKEIVKPSSFFRMSRVRRDIETVILMLSNTARILKGRKFENAERLIQKINENVENKSFRQDVKKHLESQSWIQHYLIISWLKMQILVQRKRKDLEALVDTIVYMSTSLKKTDLGYRWKFTITVVDSLVQIARNISDPWDMREIASAGLFILFSNIQKEALQECIKIFHERVRILAFIENVSLRSKLLEGIFKDLDTSSEEMCKERLKCCSKNLQLTAIRHMLHNGNYACIFSASSDKTDVIAKCYKQTRTELLCKDADPHLKDFDYECKFLSRLNNTESQHPNVVRLIAYDERNKCMSLEPVSNGSVLKFLRTRRSDVLSPKLTELLLMAVQIADALDFLEKECIIHLAMQAGNVLLHDNDNVKLTGFQFCRTLEETELKTAVKKPNFKWLDPQALLFESLSPKTVSWSFGVFLYELFTLGCVPYNQPESRPEHGDFKRESLNSAQAKIFVIRGGKLQKESCIPDSIFSIISEKCLQRDYSLRASPGELRDLLKQLIDQTSNDQICHPVPKLVRHSEDLSLEDYNPGIDDIDDEFPFAHLDVLDHAWNKEYHDQDLEEETDGYSNANPCQHEPVLCMIKRQRENHDYKEIRVLEYMEFKDIKLVEELQRLDCPELVKVVAVNRFGPSKLEMISESFSQGNVLDRMLNHPELHKNLETYLRQAASAILYLHEQGIVHRNLRAENYLLVNGQTIKLGYLGMSMKEFNVNSTYSDPRIMERPQTADPRRDAPEVLEYGNYSRRSDVWSFGVVMWELHRVANSLPRANREDVQPYSKTPDKKVLELVMSRILLQNPDPHSNSLYNVYKVCWEWDGENRPSISSLVERLDREGDGDKSNEDLYEYIDVNEPMDPSEDDRQGWMAVDEFSGEENLYMEIPDIIPKVHALKRECLHDIHSDTKSHRCPACDYDVLRMPKQNVSTSSTNLLLTSEENGNVCMNQHETRSTDVCTGKDFYDDVPVKTSTDDDTTSHYYSPVCEDDVSSKTQQDVASSPNKLLNAGEISSDADMNKQETQSMFECSKEEYDDVIQKRVEKYEDEHGNISENSVEIHSPVCKDDTFCSTNSQPADKKVDQTSTNDRESKNTDEQPQENGDDAVEPEMSSGEIGSKSVRADSSNRKGDSNVELVDDDEIDIALNMGGQGYVESVLAKFYSLKQSNNS